MKLLDLYTQPLGLVAIALFSLAGCGQPAGGPETSEVAQAPHNEHDQEAHGQQGEPIHGGWWCYEHGIPEEQCAMCDAKLAAELREKGDWCDEHNRPDSLCFKCDPSRAQKFVALYEAKYGEKPPKAMD